MTQETFEQMVERIVEGIYDEAPHEAISLRFGSLQLATRLRDELAKNQKPIGWLYTDAYGTHYTDDKREWYDAVGIEEVTPVYARPYVAAPAGVLDFEPDAKRLALELECLLLDCKDMAAVSKWWDSAHEALDQHRAMLSAAHAAPEINGLPEETADAVKNIQEPVAFLKRYPSKCQLKVEFEDAVTELAEGTYALYTNPFSSTPCDAVAKDAECWNDTQPTEQGWYWHWNGDADSAPIPTSVLYSGSTRSCFVSIGQLGISKAIDCAEYGGKWMRMIEPSIDAAMQWKESGNG